jgi:hypothetical protein
MASTKEGSIKGAGWVIGFGYLAAWDGWGWA